MHCRDTRAEKNLGRENNEGGESTGRAKEQVDEKGIMKR